MNNSVKAFGLLVAAVVTLVMLIQLSEIKPRTIFDEAFETFGLTELESCPGYQEQFEIFLDNRERLAGFTKEESAVLKSRWSQFLRSERGERPNACDWTITPYPAGFIATGERVVIVINPSPVVIGAPLPEGTTGDLVMDANRYSKGSLGGFRGAATIAPERIAVIALH